MHIEIDFSKSVHENASLYFEKSKLAAKKRARVVGAMKEVRARADKEREKSVEKEKSKVVVRKRVKEWFEKFHWFHTSDNLLVIGGRDVESNEQVVKKHLEEGDLYFHADIHGASHCVLKTKNNQAPKKSVNEAAEFAAVFSKAWEQGIPVDVYSVLPNQVSKKAPSGEFVGKGAYIISGTRVWYKRVLPRFGVGVENVNGFARILSGPLNGLQSKNISCIEIVRGSHSKSDVAKQLHGLFSREFSSLSLDLDEIMSMLPNGLLGVKATGLKR
ncbi:MAG: DUF814 domain-containing protein [Candidatus Diapherotrites archaeon]|nr:DUF814 domain-containing protein [Candidatus Diapherotrites archaeon]